MWFLLLSVSIDINITEGILMIFTFVHLCLEKRVLITNAQQVLIII